ncbi:MAG TPA: barstar family protein [Burkholderiales bacterium]|nr:barstar family protein [Burkholderiales bacterium]
MSAISLARLLDRAPAGVFMLAPDVTRQQVSTLCRARGFYFLVADCTGVATKEALLHVLARDLQLPTHFGHNWDALADCLMDMDRVKNSGVVILLSGLDAFARAAPSEWATLRDILLDAAVYWAEEPAPFYVLLAGDPALLGSDLARVTAM